MKICYIYRTKRWQKKNERCIIEDTFFFNKMYNLKARLKALITRIKKICKDFFISFVYCEMPFGFVSKKQSVVHLK